MDDRIETAAEHEEAQAMPRRHEVHADGSRGDCDKPLPKGLTKKPMTQKSPAEWAYERLILYIRNFEKQLDEEHEVAVGFAGGDTGVLRIEGLGYFDPDLVTFYGRDATGARTQLVQHVTQLSVMLRALPRPREATEPLRIGFRLAEDLDRDDQIAAPGDPAP